MSTSIKSYFYLTSLLLLLMIPRVVYCLSVKDLTLYLPFDGKVDAVYSKGDGKQQSKGAVYEFDKGVAGEAVVAGDNTKPLMSYSVKDNINEKNGSISFWFKPVDWKSGDSRYHVFFDIPDRMEFYHRSENGAFFDWLGAPQTNMIGWGVGGIDLLGVPSETGIWHHCVLTWNSLGMGSMYIDGKKSTDTDNVPKGNAPKWVEGKILRLADYTRTKDGKHKTLFDEFMVFNRALREPEARSLYRQIVMSNVQIRLRIGLISKAPSLTGRIEDWKNTAGVSDFVDVPFGCLSPADVKANIAYDKSNLYVRVVDNSGKTGGEVGILLANAGDSTIYKISVDIKGNINLYRGSEKIQNTAIQANVSKKKNQIIFECRIPLDLMGVAGRDGFLMNIVRKWSGAYGDSIMWCSSRNGNYLKDTTSYASILLGDKKPVVSINTLGQPYYCRFALRASLSDVLSSNLLINMKTSLQPSNLTEFYDPNTLYGTRSMTGEQVHLDKEIVTNKKNTLVNLEHSFTNTDMDTVKIDITDKDGGVLYQTVRSYIPDPPILITPVVYPSKNAMNVGVDISGFYGDKTRTTAEVEFIGKDGRVIIRKVVSKFINDKTSFTLPLSKLPDGKIGIRSKIKQSNVVVATIDSDFSKLGNGPWVNSKLGYDKNVLPGFTPMTVTGQTIGMYNRQYIWKDSLYPVQIISNGKELLYGPIVLSTGLKTLKPNSAVVKILEKDEQHVIIECVGQLDGVPVKIKHTLEYDGMCWSEMSFLPKNKSTFKSLALYIPFNKDECTLFQSHYAGVGRVRGTNDVEGQFLNSSSDLPIRPNYWFGNETEGLSWFCEKWTNWIVATNQNPHKVRSDEQSTTFATEFTNVPITFDKPFNIDFGIIATPVKPMPKNWRTWQCFRDFSFGWVGSITPGNNEIATPNMEFKQYAADRRSWGQMFCVPYQRPDWTNINVPEYKYFVKEWATLPSKYFGGDSDPNFRYSPVCLNSSWADYMLYYAVKAFDDVQLDGYYFDGAIPEWGGCQNTAHGCGWINENGELRQSFPIRAYREFYKKLKVEFNKRGRPSWIYAHASSSVQLPTLSFADLILGGEEFSTKAPRQRFYSKFLTNEYIRAIYNGDQYGIPMQLINELGADGSTPTIEETDDYLALLLPHGIGDLIYWNDSTNYQMSSKYSKYQLMSPIWFGVREPDCEFLPYWTNKDYLSISPVNDRIVCSLYKRLGKVFLVVGNTTPERQQVTIVMNKAKMGLPDKLKIAVVNQEKISEQNGVLTFEINGAKMGKNWQMITVSGE